MDAFKLILVRRRGWMSRQQPGIDYLQEEILIGERSLRREVDQFCGHYHGARNHQGLGNNIIEPDLGSGGKGEVRCRERLGGLLRILPGCGMRTGRFEFSDTTGCNPLILAGGQRMGIRQGQYLQCGRVNYEAIADLSAGDKRKRDDMKFGEDPMGRLLLTMLQQLGVETKEFAGCNKVLSEMLG